MTELSDYKRIVSDPLEEQLRAKIRELRIRAEAAEQQVQALRGAGQAVVDNAGGGCDTFRLAESIRNLRAALANGTVEAG